MKAARWLVLCLLVACASWRSDCASSCAGSFGTDWIVVQYRNDGQVVHCWRLPNTSIDNEGNSDGIYWMSPDGHLVHLSGWYNRVQVSQGDWDGAAKALGLPLEQCRLEAP